MSFIHLITDNLWRAVNFFFLIFWIINAKNVSFNVFKRDWKLLDHFWSFFQSMMRQQFQKWCEMTKHIERNLFSIMWRKFSFLKEKTLKNEQKIDENDVFFGTHIAKKKRDFS